MPGMAKPLIPPTFLFRFSIPCHAIESLDRADEMVADDRFIVPHLGSLERDAGFEPFAELRAAWATEGLVFHLRVTGKSKPVWCREGRIESSDGLHVWLATRETSSIARANQFCHQFAFLPAGGGNLRDRPVAAQVWIHQARAHPHPVPDGSLTVRARQERGGYTLTAIVSFAALTGFEVSEQRELGFFYEVVDSEKGRQSLSLPVDFFRFAEDPSLWARLTRRG